MSISFKICFKELPSPLLLKGDLNKFPKFEQLKEKIIEKAKGPAYKSIQLTVNDKFILEIDGFEVANLNSIWNSETYSYFFEKIKNNPPDKLKLYVVKVNKYPFWDPPQYNKILKNALDKAWEATKNELESELTEKYLDDGKRLYMEEKKDKCQNLTEEIYNNLHLNIICNNCLSSNFSGARYICCECNNFNLCQYCKKNSHISHKPEHTFIKLNTPILDDIQKYNSIFSPNKKLLKKNQDEVFELNIKIVNNGDNNLQGCFFSPIRFGENYLGCLQKTIVDKCEKGESVNYDILFTFPDNEEEYLNGSYEGFFRLMTKHGIPFGDIFYIKVIIQE